MANTQRPPGLNQLSAGLNKLVPPSERITSAVKQLAVSSAGVKSAADELCANIAPFEAALAKFDLGVSAWHQIAGHQDSDDGVWWSRDIGYVNIGRRWCIALRKANGVRYADVYEEEVWSFSEAPRWMQIEAVAKIPDLFEVLLKRTEETIKNLKAKSVQAIELTDALNAALAEIESPGE